MIRELQSMVVDDAWYQKLDPGIRFAVRILHAAGIETCECCEGGAGHAFDRATVDLPAGINADGFAALAALTTYGLPVRDLQIVWTVRDGLPDERRWRITFRKPFPERADELPTFTHHIAAI